jgi:hypothetical protein
MHFVRRVQAASGGSESVGGVIVRAHRVRFPVFVVAAAALTVLLAVMAEPTGADARVPGIQLASFPRPLLGFAHDGDLVSWALAPCGSIVAIRDLASGHTWTVKDHNAECVGGAPSYGFSGIALAGSRAIWSTFSAADFEYTSLETAVVGSRAKTVVGETTWDYNDCSGGDLVQALAADGKTAVYSYVNVNGNSGTCTWNTVLGGVYSVAPDRKLVGIPPAYALAVGDGFVATIPVDTNPAGQRLDPGPKQHKVYVYSTQTHSARTVTVSGTARGVAISRSILAVLVKASGHNLIERFQTQNGAGLGSTPVPSTSNPHSLSVSGNQIVDSTGRQIRLLEGVSGERTLLTTTGNRPIGLSLEGKRVYWAENRGGRGSILTLTLP